MSELQKKAVLMRLEIGMPGENRQDGDLTAEVKHEHGLGTQAGKWVKTLYPPEALAEIKKLDNAARAYHAAITLPFDKGIGILPAVLIMEYGDRMREFAAQRKNLVETEFLADPQKWVDWAVLNHNGTFDPDLYPGCTKEPDGVKLDVDTFRERMRAQFSFKTQPLPVPNAAHFEQTVSSLLGVDADSVDERVRDAEKEAQRELLSRLVKPVQRMVRVLKSEKPRIFDTLIGDIKEIAELGPKLNLSDDATLNEFIKEVGGLANYTPKVLREDEATRDEAKQKAAEVLNRLAGYKL